MDLVKIINSERYLMKKNVDRNYFLNLMRRARNRFGLKNENNTLGFSWPNAHKDIFFAGGCEYRLEWMGDLDMDDFRHVQQ